MAISYELTNNTIKTLDVDGLIIPFNKGQHINSNISDYTLLSFDDTATLNFALALDISDIMYNYNKDFYDNVNNLIKGATQESLDTEDTLGIRYKLSEPYYIEPKQITYDAYKGIILKIYNNDRKEVKYIDIYSKFYGVEGDFVRMYLVQPPNFRINDVVNKLGIGQACVYNRRDGKVYMPYSDWFGSKQYKDVLATNIVVFIGGYYIEDDYYVIGSVANESGYFKGNNFFNLFDIYDYSERLLNYENFIANEKLSGDVIVVKPTTTSTYLSFITRSSLTNNHSTWDPYKTGSNIHCGCGTDVGNKKIQSNWHSNYFGVYDKDALKTFFSTSNEPSEELTPVEPSGEGGDPYEKDPDSQGNNDPGGHKGGNGKYQDRDEDVPIPELPTISATDTGLCTLLNPTNEQLEKLSNFLWSDVFSVDSFKKIFADPMDVILGLSIVPLKVASDILRRINISGIDTGVEMYKCASQYIEVDCGSIDITNYWDNFMDYEPYTQYTIYLPYVGYKVLHADELVDKTITVKYHCDILSGACMAYVQCGKKVLYCFEGNISIQIPVTSASYDNMIHGMLQMASGVGQIIAGGASMAAGGAGAGLMVSGAVGTATGATSAIKPTIGRSGNAESSTGLMGIQKPYLIISRPRAVVPSGLNKYSGYPAYKGGKLGDFNNFTVVQDIRIKNLNGATMEEMNEAERLCKEGVIV